MADPASRLAATRQRRHGLPRSSRNAPMPEAIDGAHDLEERAQRAILESDVAVAKSS